MNEPITSEPGHVVRATRVIRDFVATHVGFRDVLLFGGLAIAGYGLSLVYWPAAFIVPGGVVAAVAIFGVR